MPDNWKNAIAPTPVTAATIMLIAGFGDKNGRTTTTRNPHATQVSSVQELPIMMIRSLPNIQVQRAPHRELHCDLLKSTVP